MKEKNSIFYRCSYGYAVSGMTSIIVGAILPLLMEEAGFGYLGAGSVLSFLAIGNFLGSFVFAAFSAKLGDRKAISVLSLMVAVYYIMLASVPPLWLINILMLLIGISKGSITVFNNSSMNNVFYENPAPKINLINAAFAIGAILAPFLMSRITAAGYSWKIVMYIIAAFCISNAVSYFTADEKLLSHYKELAVNEGKKKSDVSGGFLTSWRYFCLIFIIFFYLGLEYSVNGWFVTYLKDTGIMSTSLATAMVSVIWVVMLIARLAVAKLSERISAKDILFYNSIGLLLSFILLTATHNIYVIIAALMLLGLFMACVFPLAFAAAKVEMRGSSAAIAIFTAVSSLGGIITPWLIGVITEATNMNFAISTLLANAVLILILCFANKKFS